jgi:hypothetical protein
LEATSAAALAAFDAASVAACHDSAIAADNEYDEPTCDVDEYDDVDGDNGSDDDDEVVEGMSVLFKPRVTDDARDVTVVDDEFNGNAWLHGIRPGYNK